MTQIQLAPKLSDFRDAASEGERRRLHSAAMLEWLKSNVSKTGIQAETRVRVSLNCEMGLDGLEERENFCLRG